MSCCGVLVCFTCFFLSWKDQSNAFRKEPGLELKCVPTLLKVGQVINILTQFDKEITKYKKDYFQQYLFLNFFFGRNKDWKKDNAPTTILFRCCFLMNKDSYNYSLHVVLLLYQLSSQSQKGEI